MSVSITTMRVELTLLDEMLGTNPGNKKIHEDFIASKAPDAETREDEIKRLSVSEVEEKEKTIFYKDKDGKPMIPTYHIKGFFKDTCGALRRSSGTESAKVKAYKKLIDGNIFIYTDINDASGRYITVRMPAGGKIGDCQRSLRAQTMQGDRVALANSETVPKGSKLTFIICMTDKAYKPLIKEWLDYGRLRGLGQWRNSGKGAFTWKEV